MFKNILSCTYNTIKKNTKLAPILIQSQNVNRRHLYCGICLQNPRNSKSNNQPSPAISTKYEVITEANSLVIENTAEEIYGEMKYPLISDEFDGINLERGTNGVYEIEDLVELLQRENSKDIFVATVPEDIHFVQHICVVSARSKRHILALAEFIRKVYKKKCFKSDPIPRIEGKDSDEWVALDLGNIALHIFSEKTRKIYDLETLWSVGAEYDENITKSSEVVDLLENYSSYLKDLKPLS